MTEIGQQKNSKGRWLDTRCGCLSQEANLREAYYYLEHPDGNLYSTLINAMAVHLKLFNDFSRMKGKESSDGDHFLIGELVHKAIETDGQCIDEFQIPPARPDYKITKHQDLMLELMAQGRTAKQAYRIVKDNKVSRAISEEDLENGSKEDIAIGKEADSELADVMMLLPEYQSYWQELQQIDPNRVLKTDNPISDLVLIRQLFELGKSVLVANGLWLDNREHEVVVLWELFGVPVRSMLDFVVPGILVDIKTTYEHPKDFGRAYRKRAYFRQMAVYYLAYEAYYGKPPEKVFILVISKDYCLADLVEVSIVDIQLMLGNKRVYQKHVSTWSQDRLECLTEYEEPWSSFLSERDMSWEPTVYQIVEHYSKQERPW